MRLIGYWIESLRDEQFLPPQEFVGPLPDRVRRAVADHLDRGAIYAAYRGTSRCLFSCDGGNRSTDLSDGRWVWPADLGHYVQDHGVVLPEEFIRHVLAGTPPVPFDPEADRKLGADAIDVSYWTAWCRANRSGRLRLRLEEARARADAEAARLLAAAVGAQEAKEGLSSDPCRWAGCGNRALSGRVFCAACCYRGQDGVITSAPYHDLRPVLNAEPAAAAARRHPVS